MRVHNTHIAKLGIRLTIVTRTGRRVVPQGEDDYSRMYQRPALPRLHPLEQTRKPSGFPDKAWQIVFRLGNNCVTKIVRQAVRQWGVESPTTGAQSPGHMTKN